MTSPDEHHRAAQKKRAELRAKLQKSQRALAAAAAKAQERARERVAQAAKKQSEARKRVAQQKKKVLEATAEGRRRITQAKATSSSPTARSVPGARKPRVFAPPKPLNRKPPPRR